MGMGVLTFSSFVSPPIASSSQDENNRNPKIKRVKKYFIIIVL